MNEPKIRLKGFSGNWETRTIKDICEVNPKSALPSVFEYVDLESVVGTEMVSHRTERRESAPSRAQRVARKGDIFYQTVRPYQKNNYLFDKDEINYVFSTGYAQLRTKIHGGYLFTLMQSPSFVDKVLLECTGTSYPAINPTNLSKIKVDIIDNVNIQEAIASYFQHLDSLIQSTTKKIESLKQVKAASLQSMFPQEGETTPRVRFKGFEGEWKSSSLGSLFAERCEYDATAEMLSVSQSQGIIKASDNGRFDNSNSDKSKYKLVKINDIAYNSMRMWQGACGCSPYEGIVSPAYTVVTPKDNVYAMFFYYMFKTNQMLKIFRLNSQGLTSDTWNLKYPAFSKLQICYPTSIYEQQNIASYFTNLDSQITLQTQRLEKLKQIKSACLDNMFV